MSYRKFFALSILSALLIAGCSEANSNETDDLCGNNVINPGEECDGTDLGNATCPGGTGTVSCSNTCRLVYTACTQSSTCGNGILDAGETCDGAVTATCPAGTTGSVLCTGCTLDYSKCIANQPVASCGNNTIDAGEECDGKLIPAGKEVCAEGTIGTPVCVNCKLAGCIEKPSAVCGNNTVDSGEECDNNNLNNKTCADVKPGTTGTLKCSGCQFDTSACVTEQPVATCGNGQLDAGEDCDDTKFATGKDVCPTGTTGTVKCNACKLDTSACQSSDPGTCPNGEQKCSAAEEGQEKCLSVNKYAMCIGGCWTVDDCAQSGMVCNESKGGCYKEESQYTVSKCDKNVYTFGDEKETISEDCTVHGQICDDKNGCVANPNGITCDGTVLKLTGTSYSYDCANNKSSSVNSDKAKLGCVENVGCSDLFCNDGIPTMCFNDGTCEEDYDCSKFGATCDMNIEGNCKSNSDVFKCFVDNGTNIFAYCEETGCIYETCKGSCDDDNGCAEVAVEKCGDGTLESDEDCDWQGDGNERIYLWSYSKTQGNDPTCNYFDKSKVFVSGQATCKNKKGECKITVEDCVEAADSDFKAVKSWTFTSESYIANLTKTQEVTMKLRPVAGSNNNQDISEYTAGAWRTGGWSKGNADFNNYYLWFHTGAKITDTAVRVKFDVKRTNKGPKNIQLQFFDGNNALGKSESFTVTESYQTATFVYKSKSTITNLGFKLTGYNAGDGVIDVKDIVVQSVNAI